MISQPSTTADNGRDATGRFTANNKLAKGNPHARRVAKLRSALLRAVTPDDMRAVVKRLLTMAKAGDVPAAKLLIERCLGRVESLDVYLHDEPTEPQTVRVEFDDNWYGNRDRLREIREKAEADSQSDESATKTPE